MSPRTERPRLSRATEKRAAAALCILAGLAAALAGAEPTGTAGVDQVLTAAFAAVVTLAASRANRWSLLVPVAVSILAARGWALLPALASALPALVGAGAQRRSRLWGALAGGLAVQALLRLPDLGFHGLSALVAAAAVAPVLGWGYAAARRREQRVVRRVGVALAGVVALIAVGYGVLLALSVSTLDDGAAAARSGLEEARAGDTDRAAGSFARSESAFARADARVGGWMAMPARLVPVLSQHARAVASATDHGRSLAAAAGDTVETADYDRLRSTGGRFDLDLIAETEPSLRRTADAVAAADEGLADSRSPWLVAPLADELADLGDEIDRARDEADLALQAVEVAPAMLGGDGPRRYLVVFVTPVELRGSGGFIGSFAELEIAEGRLSLARTGSSTELIAPTRDAVVLQGVDEYLARYGAYSPGSDMRDLTFSPHFPLDGEVISQAYPQLGGQPIDGVISLDPIALAALLEITGPIEAPLFGQTLTAETAAEFLLRDNYAQIPDPVAQNDALSELVRLTFDELTTGDLPGPRTLASILGPATREGRIRMWSPQPSEQALIARIGASGAFPAPRPDRDFLAVASQNSGNNKLDLYQRRDIEYRPTIDEQGRLTGTVTVAVHNEVPLDAGLPDYVLQNQQGDPRGTNRMLLTVYSPHLVEAATVDGQPTTVSSQREAGFRAYTVTVVVPPGGTATLELELSGQLDVGAGYVLDLAPQPTVEPDRLAVRVGVGDRPPTVVEAFPIAGRRRVTAR